MTQDQAAERAALRDEILDHVWVDNDREEYCIGYDQSLINEAIDKALREAERRAFAQGYVCAVATLVKSHDAPTEAKDLLRCMGKIDWNTIDEYDRLLDGVYDAARRMGRADT